MVGVSKKPIFKVRLLIFFIILFTLLACNSLPRLSSPPTPSVKQVSEVAPKVQFTQATPTPTRLNSEVTREPTATSRAFEDGLPLAARVNGQPIFLETYQKRVTQFEEALRAQRIDLAGNEGQAVLSQIKTQVLEGLLDQLIIEQQANRLGLTVTKEEVESKAQETIAQMQNQARFEAWLASNNLTYQEFITNLQAQLVANRIFEHVTHNVPETAEQIQLSYMRVDDSATAQTIIEQLKKGVSFPALAQEHSLDEWLQNKAEWFPKGLNLFPQQVETIAFSLNVGEVSGPIQTTQGFYIIKLEDKATEQPLTGPMRQLLKKQIFTNWLIEQRSASEIERYVAL